ncbi:chromosomal replication initiator protein DnaA [Rothia nasimurium]|uniref:Chromosomal replication initiator protein DnaA n=1 Tax=Rothia nasimurium TaxID=85336 RepID=A0A4Y9F686_9MICC|nr:chromosomal replication initiator protein DnaA [Rothia nasimurium]TFU23913.1 chromosomal replication initiator protein DnaA [Rothia nasimurium]
MDPELQKKWMHLVTLLRADNSVAQRHRAHIGLAQPHAFMGNVLLIAVPSEFTRDIFQHELKEILQEAITATFGQGVTEAFIIDTSLENSPEKVAMPTTERPAALSFPVPAEREPASRAGFDEAAHQRPDATPAFGQAPAALEFAQVNHEVEPLEEPVEAGELVEAPAEPGDVKTWDSTARLNPKYTFDSFVIGQSNRFAHAAAFAVSETPASAYNPLFIYGGSGLGKTHLLHAIGHYAKSLYPGLRVRYVNSEEFTNDFINSIRDNNGITFKQIYRNVDMLLIDDIQFLAGKDSTQEEFFHTFNALHNHQKQVVITSDLPPKQLTGFAERMRSRFEWGLITDVQPPELETRIAILSKKAQNEGLDVPDDVMEYIASHISTNIRELEGALIRVTAFASLQGQPVDMQLAEQVLKDLLLDDGAQEITASQVLQATAEYFDVTIDDLRSKSRSRTLVNARQIAMYLLRELTDMSLPRIGQELGDRDHTTVMYADRKIRNLMAERRPIFNQVTELTNRIKQGSRDAS